MKNKILSVIIACFVLTTVSQQRGWCPVDPVENRDLEEECSRDPQCLSGCCYDHDNNPDTNNICVSGAYCNQPTSCLTLNRCTPGEVCYSTTVGLGNCYHAAPTTNYLTGITRPGSCECRASTCKTGYAVDKESECNGTLTGQTLYDGSLCCTD